jgi:hypothetical protein
MTQEWGDKISMTSPGGLSEASRLARERFDAYMAETLEYDTFRGLFGHYPRLTKLARFREWVAQRLVDLANRISATSFYTDAS